MIGFPFRCYQCSALRLPLRKKKKFCSDILCTVDMQKRLSLLVWSEDRADPLIGLLLIPRVKQTTYYILNATLLLDPKLIGELISLKNGVESCSPYLKVTTFFHNNLTKK